MILITSIAKRVNKTPAQVLLAWALQLGTALLTTSKTPSRIKENLNISTLPEDAMKQISEGIKTRQRLSSVVETGVPGFYSKRKVNVKPPAASGVTSTPIKPSSSLLSGW